MLLVIFGAGASYDSVLQLPPRLSNEDSRPPLANQLFDDRGLFVQVMNEYVACKPLVNLLRGNIQVERQLARFEEEANTFPPRRSQLAAIRYYLHHMLWNCQNNWGNHHQGITNYVTFLDAIDQWRHEHSEQVCYVTFNYDTMIERSMTDLWDCTFDTFDAYTSSSRFKLIKLHGSIDMVSPIMDATPASPSDLVKRDYKAFQRCVGNPWSPATPLPTWIQFVPTKLNQWTRQGGPDFGSSGPGMGPTNSPLPPTIPMPDRELDYKRVSDCMKQYPLAPLGGDVYMAPGDVF